MKFFVLLFFIYTAHSFTIPSRSYHEGSNKGKTEIVYKQTQTGDENYFLHIKNVYVALPDLSKLFQSIGEHATFQVNYPLSSDEDCKEPYCFDLNEFNLGTSTKRPLSEENAEESMTTVSNLTEEKETNAPESETIKNDKETVEIIESTSPKATEVQVIQQKLSNTNTHEIFIPVQVIV